MSEVLYLHQNFTDCESKLKYDKMPNVTAGYGRFSDLIAFFGNIHTLLHA